MPDKSDRVATGIPFSAYSVRMRVGTVLMLIGAGLVVIGALVRFFPGLFSWFGNLPGDIRVENENSTVFIPITSMILVSIGLTVAINLVSSIFRGR
jgi:hypothetical protein